MEQNREARRTVRGAEKKAGAVTGDRRFGKNGVECRGENGRGGSNEKWKIRDCVSYQNQL